MKATNHPPTKKQYAITLTRETVIRTERTILVEVDSDEVSDDVERAVGNLTYRKEVALLKHPTVFTEDTTQTWGNASINNAEYPTLATHIAIDGVLYPKGYGGSNVD